MSQTEAQTQILSDLNRLQDVITAVITSIEEDGPGGLDPSSLSGSWEQLGAAQDSFNEFAAESLEAKVAELRKLQRESERNGWEDSEL